MELYCENCSEWVIAELGRCTICNRRIQTENQNKSQLDEWEDNSSNDEWGEDELEEYDR